jgi:hypothetical protein
MKGGGYKAQAKLSKAFLVRDKVQKGRSSSYDGLMYKMNAIERKNKK